MKIIDSISEKIRDKYVKTSQMSERTMKETLEKLEKLIKEDASEEDALAIFETLAGNIRKEKADFAKEYEETHKPQEKPKDKKGEEKPQEQPKDDTPEWAKSMLAKFKTYDEKFAEQEKVKQAQKSKKEALEKVKIYPKSVIDVASDGFDFSVEDAEAKFIEKANRTAKTLGVTPEKTQTKDDNSDLKARFEKLKEEL